MINTLKFKLGYSIHRPKVLKYYNIFQKMNMFSSEEINEYQNSKLKYMIQYCYDNIPYYQKLFKSLNLQPKDIQTKEDLNKLPILTKEILKQNIDDFYPKDEQKVKYMNAASGGSTGHPLKYRVSHDSYNAGFALLYRGWGLAGYKLGDKVAIIAGGSLVKKEMSFLNKAKDCMYSLKHYAAYAMDEETLATYVEDMIKWKPKFIRGYPSTIYPLAKYIKKHNLEDKFKITAIFTTSEMLFPFHRDYISKVFGCNVFNTYGLHDGGITAFECQNQNGLHIDIERSILECVDNNAQSIYEEEGKILATTLLDFSMPLLRYDSGDLGILTKELCPCGCKRPLLKELRGRITDILHLNGKTIGSPALVTVMGTTSVEQYQIVQKKGENKLLFRIQTNKIDDRDEAFIKESLFSQVGDIEITFEYVNSFIYPNGEKHKLIILEEND